MTIHWKMDLNSPGVRRWPYPYQAAISISNDADLLNFDFFEAVMMYCNTIQATPFGFGLGLEVTSSFFGFSPPKKQLSYYDGLAPNAPLSDSAIRLADYISNGWVDSNHSFGDFDNYGGFHRAHAERFYEEIYKLCGDIRIFINHGDEHNSQCIGHGMKHHRGDVFGSSEYHADLFPTERVLYLTTSLHAIGDNGEAPPPLSDNRSKVCQLLSDRKPPFRSKGERLLNEYRLQDGLVARAFIRLRGTGFNAPNLGSLNYQVGLIDFNQLYKDEGGVVIYQHLGVLHRANGRCTSATVSEVVKRPELLCGLRRLAREAETGKLWVPGLLRLLDYNLMFSNTLVLPEGSLGHYELVSKVPITCPAEHFQGLSIYIDPSVSAKLSYNNQQLPIQYNGPDQTGLYSVTVPIIRKENIW